MIFFPLPDIRKFSFRAHNRIPEDGPLSKAPLWELSLYSAILFVFAALLVQVILNGTTAIMLKYFDFSFQYRPYTIIFTQWGGLKWTPERINVIYGLGPLLMFTTGILLWFFLRRNNFIAWKPKLALTWLSFIMVNTLPVGIMAGTMIFDGLGVAYQWMFHLFPVRMVFSLVILASLILSTPVWYLTFLKTANSIHYFKDAGTQRTYLMAIFFRPWLIGLLLMIPFSWPMTGLHWPVFLVFSGFPALMLFHYPFTFQGLRILRSDKKVFRSRFRMALMLLAIFLCWVVRFFRINF